jgi:hypothetical protein
MEKKMKTILIGIIITLVVSTVIISLVYNQEIKLALGIIQSQTPNYDYNREWRIEEYCMDWCNQEELYRLGCDKQTLDHLYTYSNLFDKEFDGNYVIATIGLPEGMAWENLLECVDVILEKRLLIFEIIKDDLTFDVSYAIKGGIVEDMVFSNNTNSLLVKIDSIEQGSLTLNIPRDLIDAKFDYCTPRLANPPDDRFFVILDGEEIAYDEIVTTHESRTLQIPFLENSTKIEVIATCLI